MTLGIMQPYFMPYIGYFQLINAVDKFVVYDHIQYTKKSWVNKNRFLNDGRDELFTISLRKGSDYLNINQRMLSENSLEIRKKILRKLENSYRKAPHFSNCWNLIENIFLYGGSENLFDFIVYSLDSCLDYLGLPKSLIISSEVEDLNDLKLKGKDRVINICRKAGAKKYVNPIGGVKLYDKQFFQEAGIELFFLKSKPLEYKQFNSDFVPGLSIIDVMMFNSVDDIQKMLNQYELV